MPLIASFLSTPRFLAAVNVGMEAGVDADADDAVLDDGRSGTGGT